MKKVATVSALGLVAVAACDDGHASSLPWEGRTQVVAQQDGARGTLVRGCIEFEGGSCEEARAQCEGAVDVALDRDGKLLDYLCYPKAPTWSVEDLAAHEGNIEQRDNNTVLVLDDLDDGADITGDVSIDANNVVLYGDDAATSMLDGSLTLDGNNALVRGLHITGDVTVLKNDVTLAFCLIDGSLTVSGNNVRLLGCDVLGDIDISGNNARLSGNGVAGTLSAGKNAACEGNHTVVVDANGVVTEGAPLGC